MCKHPDMLVEHVDTNKQGDILTKGLQRPKHEPAMRMVGLYPIILYE